MEVLKAIINQYMLNPDFVKVMAITWLILQAAQQIDWVAKWSNQYKAIASLILGAIFGFVLIESSLAGLVAGIFAGGAITLTVKETKVLAKRAYSNSAKH